MRIIWIFSCFACVVAFAATTLRPIDFEVVKKESSNEPTLLLIGGIQGDEPGGFNATNVFLNHYTIKKGSVWVVPVLNPHSMLLNHRGIYDDMNRKFAALNTNDPEKPIIDHIKELIQHPRVQAVLHLHDGSGFYRPTFESNLANPNRWGNCSVIDQKVLEGVKFGELHTRASAIIDHINAHLLSPIHRYHLHNTQTAEKDKEMQKALTYFAITHGKPGYANEASKELGVAQRVYYHLLAIESMLDQMGIEYERDFTLTPQNVQKAIKDKSQTFRVENLPTMPLFDLRPLLAQFPIPKGKQHDEIAIHSNTKILGFLPQNLASPNGGTQKLLTLKYGNNVMTKLSPKYVEFYEGKLPSLEATIDGETKPIQLGERIRIGREIVLPESIIIDSDNELRLKVIGLAKGASKDSAITITKSAINPQSSLDKAATLYRAEYYVRTKLTPPEPAQEPESKVDSNAKTQAQSSTQVALESNAQHSSANADSSDVKARISVNLAHIRQSPSLEAPIVAKAPQGRILNILTTQESEIGQWAQIHYTFTNKDGISREIQGFVLARLLQKLDSTKLNNNAQCTQAALESNAQHSSANADSSDVKARISVNLAHIRQAPSLEAPIVAKAPQGRILNILTTQESEIGQWAQIHYTFTNKDGISREIQGFVLARLLQKLDSTKFNNNAQCVMLTTKEKSKAIKPNTSQAPKQSLAPRYKESFGGMIVLEFAP